MALPTKHCAYNLEAPCHFVRIAVGRRYSCHCHCCVANSTELFFRKRIARQRSHYNENDKRCRERFETGDDVKVPMITLLLSASLFGFALFLPAWHLLFFNFSKPITIPRPAQELLLHLMAKYKRPFSCRWAQWAA